MRAEDLYVDASKDFDYSKVNVVVQHIANTFRPLKIIVFGSVSRGEAHNGSDIDILVVMNTTKRKIDQEKEIYLSMPRIGVPTDILVITPEQLRKWASNPYSIINTIVNEGVVAYEA